MKIGFRFGGVLAGLCISASVLVPASAFADPVLVSERPWGSTNDQAAMDIVFGAGNWTLYNTYAAANTAAGSIFAADTGFVFLQGGAGTDVNLNGFLTSNGASILNWVDSGGSLLLESAGWNESVRLGQVTLVYNDPALSGYAATGQLTAAGQAVFTSYPIEYAERRGNWLSHNYVLADDGVTLITFIEGNNEHGELIPVVAGYKHGDGYIVYSGLTLYDFHSQIGGGSLGADAPSWLLNMISGFSDASALDDQLSGGRSVFAAADNVGNKQAFGAARIIDATPALLAQFDGLGSDAELSEAASQTLPLLSGGTMFAANAATAGINRVVQARIESNKGLSSGETFLGDRHVWLRPFGSWADQGTSKGVKGFRSDTAGVAFGVDAVANDALRLGVAFAYAKADVDGKSRIARHSAKVDVYQLIGYGSYSLDERTELNFQVNYGQNRNSGRRNIAFTDTVAKSNFDSQTVHIGVGLGRSYPLNERTTFTPSARVDYTWIKDKSYREKGADVLNLNVRSRSTDALVLAVDGKVSHEVKPGITLMANVGAGYDLLSERTKITAAFAGAPGAAFTTRGIDQSRWLMRGGLGVSSMMSNGMEVVARYDLEARDRFNNQTASVRLRWAF